MLFLSSYNRIVVFYLSSTTMSDAKSSSDQNQKEVRGCVSLVTSPMLLFSKIILNSNVNTKKDDEYKRWYGDQTQVVDFVTKKRKCIKQMFQQEFDTFAFSRIMFDAKQNDKYLEFLRTMTDPAIQHLDTKEFKNVAWKRWGEKLESM